MKPRAWVTMVISDVRLSIDARGLLCWLGSRPARWRYAVEDCISACGWGRQKFQKVLRELKDAGWVHSIHKRDGGGRIVWTDIAVSDKPSRKVEFQPSGEGEKRGSRKPDFKASGPRAENQPRLKNSNNRGRTLSSAAAWNAVTHPGRAGNA